MKCDGIETDGVVIIIITIIMVIKQCFVCPMTKTQLDIILNRLF